MTGSYRMCGRFTVKATWAELVALYRLTMDAPPHNLRPRYNVCPTDPVDVVTAEEGKRELVPMRWGLIPRCGVKPSKTRRWRRSTPGQRRSRPNRCFVTHSSGRAASSRCRAITSGRMPPAESSRGISRRERRSEYATRAIGNQNAQSTHCSRRS